MSQSLTIQHILRFLDILEDFQKRKNCSLNLSKLFELWDISIEDLGPFIQILLRLQSLFNNEFSKIRLYPKWKNSKYYLRYLPFECDFSISTNDREIELTREDCDIINDVIQYFEHVKIGKGFNLKANSSDFAFKIKQLNKRHPYFFEIKEPGMIYPTKLVSQLAKVISQYSRGNHKIRDFEIETFKIKVR